MFGYVQFNVRNTYFPKITIMTLVHKNGHNLARDQYLSAIIHETGGPPQRGAGSGSRETKVSFGVA